MAFGVGKTKAGAVAGIVETKVVVVVVVVVVVAVVVVVVVAVAAARIGGSKATAAEDFERMKGHADTGNTERKQCFVAQIAVAVVSGEFGYVGMPCVMKVDRQLVGYTGLLTDMSVLEKKGYESDHPGGRHIVNSVWVVHMVHPLADLSVIMSTPVKALINRWNYLRSLFCPAP
jgi:hypothetical protein